MISDFGNKEKEQNSLIFVNSKSSSATNNLKLRLNNNNVKSKPTRTRRHSSYDHGSFMHNKDLTTIISNYRAVFHHGADPDEEMCDQEDIIALTRHVRSFSDTLNNLRNTFKESTPSKILFCFLLPPF